MIDYLVKNSGAPYFRWAGGAIKARQGNLAAGHKVFGSISGQFGQFLVIPSGLSGEAPLPYAMYLKDLEPVPVELPVEPPANQTPYPFIRASWDGVTWYNYTLDV